VKSVKELLQNNEYEGLAKRYFDWLAVKIGNGNFESGIREIARKYNAWVFSGKPFTLPDKYEVEAWLFENGIILDRIGPGATGDQELLEINRCVECEIRNRIEERLRHRNPLNP